MNHYQAAPYQSERGFYHIPVISGCCPEGLGFLFLKKRIDHGKFNRLHQIIGQNP